MKKENSSWLRILFYGAIMILLTVVITAFSIFLEKAFPTLPQHLIQATIIAFLVVGKLDLSQREKE